MNNADKQYQNLLKNIIDNGRQKGDRTGTGTISIPYATLDFDMSKGFPLLTTKKVFTKAIVHELLWFLKGDTNVRTLEQNGVSIWSSDAYREYCKHCNQSNLVAMTKEEFIKALRSPVDSLNDLLKTGWDLGPVYGAQWRRWKAYSTHKDSPEEFDDTIVIDQVQQAMDKLINNPDDRRIIVSAWNVGEIDRMALPPCHYMFQLYSEELTYNERYDYVEKNGIKLYEEHELLVNMLESFAQQEERITNKMNEKNVPKRRLSLIWDQRSCDTFLGIPFNIASYGILLHMFAQQANMVPDRLIGSLKNVHIYNNHKDQCLEQISREPRALPQIQLNKAKDIFSYCYEDVKFLNYNPHDTIKGVISV